MVGSHTSVRPKGSRFWIALLGILAIVATACGAGEETITAPTMERSAEEQLADLEATASESPTTSRSIGEETGEGGETEDSSQAVTNDEQDVSADEEAVDAGSIEDDVAEPQDVQTAAVLAYAIEVSEDRNFTFEQGMKMDLNVLGMQILMNSDEPMADGVVNGDLEYVRVDLGPMLESMFGQLAALDPNAASEIAAIDFDAMVVDTWTDGEVIVVDMSGYLASLTELDPSAAAGLEAFAEGPVKLDIASLAAAQGLDVADVLAELEMGAQYTDPATLFAALRNLEVVDEVGTDVVDGAPVTVYSGSITFAAYMDALGGDLSGQLGGFGDLGIDPSDPMMGEMIESLDSVPISITVMIDDEDLVRRIDIAMDMSPMFESMFGGFTGDASADDEMAALFGDMTATVDVWQTFDNYGSAPEVVLPDAPDASADFLGLVES